MAADPVALARAALAYGPQTQGTIRRSRYLSDALAALSADNGKITGGLGEVGTKLLAQAILQRASRKADDELRTGLKGDMDSRTESLIAALGGGKPKPAEAAPAAPILPEPAAAAPLMPAPRPEPVMQAPLPPAQPQPTAQLDPNVDAIVRTVWGEARGEDPQGQAAVAGVILNRARERGMGPRDVVMQPGQFEPWQNPQSRARMEALTPESPEYQAILANISPALQGQNPVGGADHFYSPSAQQALGRQPPKWDNGRGQDLGRHRFFDLEQGAQQAQVPPPPPPPNPNGPDVQNVAASGAGADPFPPSAPASSPSASGAPLAAPAPQANAAGGMPQQWPTWKPSQPEVAYVESLLRDPRTHEQGVQAAMKLQQKMTQPVEAKIEMINSVPFYVPATPTPGMGPVMIPVPPEAMTQQMTAQAAGLGSAPQGMNVQRDPLGKLSEAPGAPPEGYQASPTGALQPRQGGPADPYRPQAPSANYQYTGQGQQAPIQGSPADPRNITNVMEGASRVGGMVKTIADSAMKVRQNFGAVQTGLQQRNGTGDIAAINGLQKLIDDGVVKGEDVNMQMKSNGLEGTLGGWVSYASSNGLLPPDVREKIGRTAQGLYKNLDQTYRVRIMSMQPGFDEVYGQGAFSKYVFPQAFAEELGWAGPDGGAPAPQPQPGPASAPVFKPGTPDAGIAEAVKRGMRLTPAQQQRAKQLGILR